MLVASFPAGTFQTNCYLVAASSGAEALVVDPGQDAMSGVDELCARHHLRPVAVLVTHGHLDHIWTVAPLAGARGIPAWSTRTTATCSATRWPGSAPSC